MLDAETKRRIDTARDILVGKVPDPKSQVEQITIALIYKFMDDMDAESEEMGGERKFFAGEFTRYGWPKLVRSGLGGHEMLNLYAEAIARMPENPGIPQLFRSIFNNAYLPYRDPETLRAFLRIIDEFKYDHSERLGDAFEYLLSVLGSQGDAGQFRTPRHIIDFIVAIVDPKKDETVLDPACGTAGFLISSYQHILAANADANGRPSLTPDERARLVSNFKGYDISPDMVRLSLVNMYLHEFAAPSIDEYDTLTSEDKWNEYADVILANPPFMSPKGGIRPHNRFSVQSRRSEVLFVDYMAEHLTANGRAGIIVPEGVIFQSQRAHTQLRKMLVEGYLAAVVSLPAGVFQPYSGVKTSILVLDKTLARRADHIAFFKVENDGYDLGAQRREIAANDLPAVQAELGEYLRRLRGGLALDDFAPATGLVVAKERIADGGDYNLSGERYRESAGQGSQYEWVELGDILAGKPQYGSGAKKVDYDGEVRYVRITDITDDGELKAQDVVSPSVIEPDRFLAPGDLLIARSGSVGRTYIHDDIPGVYQYAGYLIRFRINATMAIPEYVYCVTKSDSWREWIFSNSKTGTLTNINAKQYSTFRFPLPPLEVQRETVGEIEGYQRVIDGARAVVYNWRPRIAIDPEWPLVGIGAVCTLVNGRAFKPNDWQDAGSGGLPIVRIQNLNSEGSKFNYYTGKVQDRYIIHKGQLLFSWSGSRGTSFGAHIWDGGKAILNQHIFKVEFDHKTAIKAYLLNALNMAVVEVEQNLHGGVGLVHITKGNLERIRIPLPPLETQQAIVAEIEAEQALVSGNRELIERMEGKVQAAIGRVWEGVV